MTVDVARFELLAGFIAGCSVEVAYAPAGQLAHTDGNVIFIRATASTEQQRKEVVLQGALLAAGSLQPQLTRALLVRPRLTRRYLALEGHRALHVLAARLPLAATLCPDHPPASSGADQSLAIAKSRRMIPDPPEWFGVIKPQRPTPRSAAPDVHFEAADPEEPDDPDDDNATEESKILKLFEAPAMTVKSLSEFLRKLLGSSPSSDDKPAGAELALNVMRRGRGAGQGARPSPVHITTDKPGSTIGVGGALYPEWDVHKNRYRDRWCRVIDFPLTAADGAYRGAAADPVLRRRLSRIVLGIKALRRRPDGDDVDTDALVDLFIDAGSGRSTDENIYIERRKLSRDLGVLILLDASGSAGDTDAEGRAVHELQREAAATLTATLDELGDRVALYGFRSHGRSSVHLPAVKTFDQQFGAAQRNTLDHLDASGYTRLGAGIRGAGEILKNNAGTPNRLLIVVSDGYPYDDGYEGRYAQADSAKALEELRLDGVACLCLSIGGHDDSDVLEKVFGPASHAHAPTLAELSPIMDQLFQSALRELALPAAKTLRRRSHYTIHR